MNKKDLIISYIIALICIYYMSTLDYPADWYLPFCICLLLLYPLTIPLIQKLIQYLMQKFPKYKEFRQKNEIDGNKILEQYTLSFIYFILTICCFCLSIGYNTDKGVYIVATVSTPEKASEIQALLTKEHRSTGRSIVVNKENNEVRYVITLSRYEVNEKQWFEAISELKNSPVMDDSIEVSAEEK